MSYGMKIDFVKTIIAVFIGILVGWGYYALAQNPADSLPIGLVLGIETSLLGIGMVSIAYEDYPRSGVAIRATCAFGAFLLLVINAIYAYTGINTSFYVLNGILSLILLLTVNCIYKSKQ
jgi:heme/copper-type cytochrome/quinol oxidase subunit 3